MDERFRFEYIKTLAVEHFGIPSVSLIKAEMLDAVGYDVNAILQEAVAHIDQLVT